MDDRRAYDERFNAFSMGVHWLTFALLVAVYALIELRGLAPKGTPLHDAMKTWHFMLGLVVFGIVYVRLGLRAVFPPPPIVPEPPAWQRYAASAMEVTLYAFLIVMPVLGWLTLSAKGRVIPFFGLELPSLLGPDKALAKNFQNIHETIGTIGYYLVGLHVSAALFHHYVMHDNTLVRMLPRWRRSSRIARLRES